MEGLTAAATISAGSVTGITITGYTIGQRYIVDSNNDYVEQENYSNKVITIDGNAEAEIVLGKRIGNIWITNEGDFDFSVPVAYIRGIGGSPEHELDATCDVKKEIIFNVLNGGYGYDPDTAQVNLSWITGPYQFTPTAKAEFDDEGRVTEIKIVELGDFALMPNAIATVSGFAPGGTYDVQTKCARDIGLIIDSYIYHLQLGGNEKVVNAAQLYYTKNDYPYGEKLYHIDEYLTETLATFEYAKI